MDRRFLAILSVIVLALIGIFIVSQHSGNSNNSNSGTPTNHLEGKNSAGVTLTEYGDFQCPVCESYYVPVKDAVSQLSSKIQFQFRNLPLTSLHPNAFAGARAAEAASLQGKFWQMHDALYTASNYDQWAYNTATGSVTNEDPKPFFDQYAKDIGLNVTKFDSDYTSSQVNDSINADLNAFSQTGQQQATPSFFINGQFVANTNFADQTTGQPSAALIVAYVNNYLKNH